MIILLAPSKTMDFEYRSQLDVEPQRPLFEDDSRQIVAELTGKSEDEIRKIFSVSPDLARATKEKYTVWADSASEAMALWAYIGDVYKGLYAKELTQRQVEWTQQHLLILSGLYGALRPLDAIKPYRLEMKAPLHIKTSRNLYDFWGDKLAKYADKRAAGIICVLSSDEYARVVTRYATSRIVTPVFMDKKPDGSVLTVPIYSKMMRGVLANWMIVNAVNDPDELRSFSAQGYTYDESRSSENQPVFYRDKPSPIRFR